MGGERISRTYLCVTLGFTISRDSSCVDDIYITQHSTIKKWFSCEFWNKWGLIWNEFEITAHLALKKKKQKLRMFVSETKIVYIQVFDEVFDECKETSLTYLFNNKVCAASSFCHSTSTWTSYYFLIHRIVFIHVRDLSAWLHKIFT
jgi:uncharacterized membrane protein